MRYLIFLLAFPVHAGWYQGPQGEAGAPGIDGKDFRYKYIPEIPIHFNPNSQKVQLGVGVGTTFEGNNAAGIGIGVPICNECTSIYGYGKLKSNGEATEGSAGITWELQ